MKVACLSGTTGQVASYLVELLLEKDYKVYGLVRKASTFNTERIDHIYKNEKYADKFKLVFGDLADYSSIVSFISEAKPDLFFNMGAMSHVRVSFDIPEYTMDVTGTGVIRCLEAIRKHSPKTRFMQASSSELFGNSPAPQNENTKIHPRSPYACAKAAGYYATINYREAYGLFAANAITFNTESPRRGETFVTRKITRAATRIKLGLQYKLVLGNLESRRDWGYAKDNVEAMYKIITADEPDDFVIATGETRSVKDFLEIVFSKLGLDWKQYVEFDPRYLRPTEVPELWGDPTKIKTKLGWAPKYTFEQLVDNMIQHDMALASQEKILAWNSIAGKSIKLEEQHHEDNRP